MRVRVDREKCCGAGQCVLAAPGVFDQSDEEGIVVLLDPTPPAGAHAAVRDAAAFCPAGVIAFEEA
ncbi:ferredoxin [Actinacidiphila sp. ITFR-21]|uniref:ferredoxin n=1 Tax=Actinacidiphila sp. ITFR-21 TaxID=3075199 RepID=UPI002889416E|nr:ferredoxin [Streptomyces sp. ITFR-21]WNI19506.1 ferredoxin [Streptomyces sp. ITFR-21]